MAINDELKYCGAHHLMHVNETTAALPGSNSVAVRYTTHCTSEYASAAPPKVKLAKSLILAPGAIADVKISAF